jgi:phospholipase C
MVMAIIANNAVYSFCFTLITISLSVLFLFSYLLVEQFSMEVYGLAPDSDAKSNTPIKHIIVISQGKRSFDNYFGTFPGANGVPKNLTVPLNPFPYPVVKFTVAAWFNTNNTLSKNGFLVNKGGIGIDTPGKNMNYGIWMDNNSNIMAGFETKNGKDFTVESNHTYNDGKWHYVVVTYNGNSELKLFIDGNLSGSNQTGGAIPDFTVTQPVRIGANALSPDNFFTGFVDEVRIWNRTLGYSEILKGYNNNTFDGDGQLVYLSFEDGGKKNEGNNVATSGSLRLNGIYLNGSFYQDVKMNSSHPTKYIRPFQLEQTKTESPYASSEAYKTSYNSGLMNGFRFSQVLSGNDPNLVMGYYDDKQLPYYWKLASEFVLADNFFAPTMETGLANYQYLYTASPADYQKNITFRNMIDLNKTIFDELEANGLSWRVYVQDYDPALNYTNNDLGKNRYINLLSAIPRFVDNDTLNSNIVDIVEYFRDLRNDNFPAVSYIVAPSSDESSPRAISAGQEFVSSLVLALMKSKHWNDSAFIITYRESGGWYDHVAPPVIDGHAYGFRVPTLIISPFAKKGYVDSTFYDVKSILKFIEYNYGLSPISVRDAKANNMLDAFEFTLSPQKPLVLNSSAFQDEIQGKGKIIDKNGENIYKVNLVYLVVISIIPVIGLITWILSRRRTAKLDIIQKQDT